MKTQCDPASEKAIELYFRVVSIMAHKDLQGAFNCNVYAFGHKN